MTMENEKEKLKTILQELDIRLQENDESINQLIQRKIYLMTHKSSIQQKLIEVEKK